MQIPFPFDSMLAFGALACMLLFGVLLRARVTYLQRFLIPSCLIGGTLGLIILNMGMINPAVNDLETFAYHFFNISFISVGLTGSTNHTGPTTKKRKYWKGSLWMALTQTIVNRTFGAGQCPCLVELELDDNPAVLFCRFGNRSDPDENIQTAE